ncbi:MAG TPA: translational GTPase TypA [Chroococcales cyanobacterium]|jgi:GTP-binding protein
MNNHSALNENIRNVAIIAHVDHGKTTLVDCLLRQSGVFRQNEVLTERVMDSNDLERERGITILSKNTAVRYHGTKINIVDTPGHADFGGEVERVLGMVDGCLLVVDAFEGPMPQTRFVLRKALAKGLKIIVVVNKVDRQDARPLEVVDLVLDLFIDLGADEKQIDFPVIFASATQAFAKVKMSDPEDQGVKPLFDCILKEIPAPTGDTEAPLQLQAVTLDYSEYLGRILIGRINNGEVYTNQPVMVLRQDGSKEKSKIIKLFTFDGLKRLEAVRAVAGDIVAISGIEASIGDTIASPEEPVALPPIKVEEPTLQMTFAVNDSPFAGREGKFVTSRQVKARLMRELLTNVSLRVEDTATTDSFLVSGRGELHLGIMIETMRREGFEFQVSKPKVILKQSDKGVLEPFENLVVDVPESCSGSIIDQLSKRRGELQKIQAEGTRVQLDFVIPARGLIGFRLEFIRLTRGEGIMYHTFEDYRPYAGDIVRQRNGAMIAWEEGVSTAYALLSFEDRGAFFIGPGVKVYGGMIVGEHSKTYDIDVNVCKAKKLTNIRSAGGEELVRLTPPIDMGLEKALEYIGEDEMVEVTPMCIRLRKLKTRSSSRS